MRDMPDPKEDSERPFVSFSATEVKSSAATTTSKEEKGTWPFAPSPATCPWSFAEREKPVIDFGRQSKHDPTYMFDTDGERGSLHGTALMSSPAPVAYNNASDCSNLVHVLVDSGASDHYFNDFLILELNRVSWTIRASPRLARSSPLGGRCSTAPAKEFFRASSPTTISTVISFKSRSWLYPRLGATSTR